MPVTMKTGASAAAQRRGWDMSSERETPEMTREGAEAAIRLLGRRGSPTAYAIRDFLHRSDVPFRWVELSSDEEAECLLVLRTA